MGRTHTGLNHHYTRGFDHPHAAKDTITDPMTAVSGSQQLPPSLRMVSVMPSSLMASRRRDPHIRFFEETHEALEKKHATVVNRLSGVVIIEESQPVKNRNLSRLISNLRWQNSSSERNSVFWFSTVFTLLQ
jgi:hypothetical protein